MFALFLILSIGPYFFHLKNPESNFKQKPYSNSFFNYADNTYMHFRLFIPKTIKTKIVLIPGFSGSWFSFRNNIQNFLNNGALVVAIDVPPYGYSDKNPMASYSDTTIIKLIKNTLQKVDNALLLDHSAWVVMGHSLGVTYSGKLVSEFPDLFVKQIYIDGFFVNNNSKALKTVLKYPPLLKLADVYLEKMALSENNFSSIMQSAYLRKPSYEEITGYMNPFKIKYSASAILKWASSDNTIEINRNTINNRPTLFIWGKLDTWLPYQKLNPDTASFKNYKFYFIDSSGHNPQETHFNEVNRYFNNFIFN